MLRCFADTRFFWRHCEQVLMTGMTFHPFSSMPNKVKKFHGLLRVHLSSLRQEFLLPAPTTMNHLKAQRSVSKRAQRVLFRGTILGPDV
jgi:hypothetical protein